MVYKHPDPKKQQPRGLFNKQLEDEQYNQAFESSKKVNNFLKLDITRESTIKSYKRALKGFFYEQKIKDIDNYFKNPESLSNGKKLAYKDELELKIKQHHYFLINTLDYEGNTINVILAAIRSFLETNKIELGDKFWSKLKRTGKGTSRVTDTKTPDLKTLREILNQGDIESKAAFLLQMNTGARIDQIPALEWINIKELDNEYPIVLFYPDQNKTKREIKTFMTPETKEILLQYRKQREKIINTRAKRGNHLRKNELNKNKIFPMTTNNLEKKWRKMCEKAGYYQPDSRTNRPSYGTHCLRRFFLDNFGDRELAKLFCGKTTPNEEAYHRKSDNELRRIYAQHADNITILKETSENLLRTQIVEEELNKVRTENESLRKKILENEGQNQILRDQFKGFDEKIKKLDNIVDGLVSQEINPIPFPGLEKAIRNLKPDAEQEYEKRVNEKIQERKRLMNEQIKTDPRLKESKIIEIDGVPFYIDKDVKNPITTRLEQLKKVEEIREQRIPKNKQLQKDIEKVSQELKSLLLKELKSSIISIDAEGNETPGLIEILTSEKPKKHAKKGKKTGDS